MNKLAIATASLLSISPAENTNPLDYQNITSHTEIQMNEIKKQTNDSAVLLFQETNSEKDSFMSHITAGELTSQTNQQNLIDTLNSVENIPVNQIVDGIMKYFDKEVKNYNLNDEAKKKVRESLSGYFVKHKLFQTQDGRILIKITNNDLPDFFSMCNNLIDIFADNLVWYKRVAVDVFGLRKMMKRNVNNFQNELPKASEVDIMDIAYDIGKALQYIEKESKKTLYLSEYYKSANRLANNPYLKKNTNDFLKSHPTATIRDLPDTSKK